MIIQTQFEYSLLLAMWGLVAGAIGHSRWTAYKKHKYIQLVNPLARENKFKWLWII